MAMRPLKSFFPTADELLATDLPRLGEVLLAHLNSYEDRVKQSAGVNKGYFRAMLENRNVGLGPLPPEPEYGSRQPDVTKRMMEAWNWLERQGHLIHNDQPSTDWFTISSAGEEQVKRFTLYEQLERLGLDRVKNELAKDRPRLGGVGGGSHEKDWIWDWVRNKESKPPLKPPQPGEWVLIDDGRLAELRALKSSKFDFKRLVCLCEELNIASREDCYFAIGMLTRGLLDHVPPVFGVTSFSHVANNYAGGTKSFKDTMLHLDTAAKKIADGLLHTQIRNSETLPNRQQVSFGPALDVLLGEIVRITQ